MKNQLIAIRKTLFCTFSISIVLIFVCTINVFAQSRKGRKLDGDGKVTVTGELKQWHAVTLNLSGPYALESDTKPNPFTDLRFIVTFEHESGTHKYKVPGYFAADGNAAETSAVKGNIWRAHLSPDKIGKWNYSISFEYGPNIAMSEYVGKKLTPWHGKSGSFVIQNTDKKGRDFRRKGRLQYVGKHHLQFIGTGEYFLKAGPDSPETLLGYADFDNTHALKEKVPIKKYEMHITDWKNGDPTWKDNKGKGLIGALNYLADEGVNSISFLPYNAGGDGDNVWPFTKRNDKYHYDCSKLDQWGIVFSHAQKKGLHLHFKLQETEMDDRRRRRGQMIVDYDKPSDGGLAIPESLDGGATGPERKLYFREIIARYGHHLALNWNLGEENTQTEEEHRAMANYISVTDPYNHNLIIHSYPNMQEQVYEPLLGNGSVLTGASLQNMWNVVHERTWKWVTASENAGRPWVVANDEQGSARTGVPPDPGYKGFSGTAEEEGYDAYDLHDVRKYTLWGNIMAGGAGVEYYFGYRLAENDLVAEDFRSRDQTWDYCRIALDFFQNEKIPFWEMKNADHLVGNYSHYNTVYCLMKPSEIYLIYIPNGDDIQLDLRDVPGEFTLSWFNPRKGGPVSNTTNIGGGQTVILSAPQNKEDWLAVIKRKIN